jgi:hydrogenase maturation protein HypF
MDRAASEGRRIRIQGTVQGVGFRPWVYRAAEATGVAGRVLNDSLGVTIEAFGHPATLDSFERALHVSPPPAAEIVSYDTVAIPVEPANAFVIVESQRSEERRVSIPPDLATCDDCVAEIFDPNNRRYRYPFTNCTNCGPRFTIATDVPYDRENTTMAPFEMCARCRREYEAVTDRRFHAQPIACPVCGPRLLFCGQDGSVLETEDVVSGSDPRTVPGRIADPVGLAAQALCEGWIVALKGIGGFHLACDATSASAVERLRRLKHRDEKPFAVMVPTLAAAERLGFVGVVERRLLTSVERPIVLLEKREPSPLADIVAPRNHQVGVMLPYAPLHHLLLHDASRPLVMTSGNLSEEPIVVTNADAIRRLRGIADFFLIHNREIKTRCDDSVAAVISNRPVVLRRSRGYVPHAVPVAATFAAPVLACGALLKNTFCLGSGRQAWLGPHIGDLENLETFESFTHAIEAFQRFLHVQPRVIAHDLHPDYLSTRYALSRSEAIKIGVQHHHAHVVAGMAEHQLSGPVIGLAYDGTGYGTDGTSWGGEMMLATATAFERLATFRPVTLAGGDRAIREPWRIAVALALDAYDGELPRSVMTMMKQVTPFELNTMTSLIKNGVQTSLARGVGRYFDAFAALFLDRRRAAFEGQLALEWNQIAARGVRTVYPFDINAEMVPWEIDLRPALRAAVGDRVGGTSVGVIAAKFHNTLVAATASAVRRIGDRVDRLPVVASGGCFQNPRLAAGITTALSEFHVYLHERVPPGDGGIALGQAVVAQAIHETNGSGSETELQHVSWSPWSRS